MISEDLEELVVFLRKMHKKVTKKESKERLEKWGMAVKESISLWKKPLYTKKERMDAAYRTFFEGGEKE